MKPQSFQQAYIFVYSNVQDMVYGQNQQDENRLAGLECVHSYLLISTYALPRTIGAEDNIGGMRSDDSIPDVCYCLALYYMYQNHRVNEASS